MEGAVRVFAGEFSRGTLSVPCDDDTGSSFVVTPGGARCRLMFITGALIEVEESGDMLRARVADPTGGFDLVVGGNKTELNTHLRSIPVPSFISVLGRAQPPRRNGRPSVRPEQVHLIDRATRDRWVLSTAAATLHRIECLRRGLMDGNPDPATAAVLRHYNTGIQDLEEIVSMAEDAIRNVRPEPEPAVQDLPDIRNLVVEQIRASKSPRGIAVQEILDTLASHGIPQQGVLATIESLIVEDECYQPQKGFVRLL